MGVPYWKELKSDLSLGAVPNFLTGGSSSSLVSKACSVLSFGCDEPNSFF